MLVILSISEDLLLKIVDATAPNKNKNFYCFKNHVFVYKLDKDPIKIIAEVSKIGR